MWRTLASALILVAPAASAAETLYVNAPLTSAPTAAGVTVGTKGGSFGAEGWTTTGDEDALWFLIPASLPTARVEVSVKGISDANLDGEEHDIIVTYGETDRPEPVDYTPAYRNNNFKTNLRIFGAQSAAAGGRPRGSNKLELRLCPAGLPGHSESCPAGCADVFEVAYLSGKPESIPWVATTSYRMKIAWSPGTISYTRGVEPAVSIGYPGTLAPKALRVRIGSPRHGVGSVNRMPKGITFRDLVIAGEPGAATAVCGGTVAPDAGADAGCTISAAPLEKVGDRYRATYRGCGGLRIVQFWIGDVVDPVVPNLSGGFEAGRLFLGDQSCTPGEAKTLTTAQGSLDCARTTVTTVGSTLMVDWAVRANPEGLGLLPRPFFVDAKGGAPETRLGWTRIGTYGESSVVGDDAAVSATDADSDAGVGDARRPGLDGDQDLGGGELACSCAMPGRSRTLPTAWWLALLLIPAIQAARRRTRPSRDGLASGR